MNVSNGTIASLQICPARHEPMRKVESGNILEDHGFEGDCHARAGGKRQVLLIDEETLGSLGLVAGMIKENITTRGVDFGSIRPGMRLRIGEALLEITMVCTPCELMDEIRPGLRKTLEGQRGMLARVLGGGKVSIGDTIEVVG